MRSSRKNRSALNWPRIGDKIFIIRIDELLFHVCMYIYVCDFLSQTA